MIIKTFVLASVLSVAGLKQPPQLKEFSSLEECQETLKGYQVAANLENMVYTERPSKVVEGKCTLKVFKK
jgi:uncharacterized iron-regulated protein